AATERSSHSRPQNGQGTSSRIAAGLALTIYRARQAQSSYCSVVIFDVGEALVAVGRPLQPGAFLARLPLHHVLDLACEREVLVGDALGRVVLQPDLDPGVGRGDVGVMPRGLGEVA